MKLYWKEKSKGLDLIVLDDNEDEFVELVNVSNSNLDISGYEFYDNTNLMSGMPNHVVPPGTILSSMKAYVVFGLIPDFKALINSPIETTSAPKPNFPISFSSSLLGFAFTAKQISGFIFLKFFLKFFTFSLIVLSE